MSSRKYKITLTRQESITIESLLRASEAGDLCAIAIGFNSEVDGLFCPKIKPMTVHQAIALADKLQEICP